MILDIVIISLFTIVFAILIIHMYCLYKIRKILINSSEFKNQVNNVIPFDELIKLSKNILKNQMGKLIFKIISFSIFDDECDNVDTISLYVNIVSKIISDIKEKEGDN